jgi:hypothetical protein
MATRFVILTVSLGSVLVTSQACNGNESFGTTGGAGGISSVGGQVGSGGRSDAGGHAPGSGGSSTDAGSRACGSTTCAAGDYCCNPSCGICAPMGAACIQIACLGDAGITGDANACVAQPSQDGLCADAGHPPHYYRCDLTLLPPPCVQVYVGNVLQAFCCS